MDNNQPFSQMHNEFIMEGQKILNDKFGRKILFIENVINLEWEIFSRYHWTLKWPCTYGNEQEYKETMLLSGTFIKNLFTLREALLQLKNGSMGISMVLLRQSFEYLMISKYARVSSDVIILQKWNEGDYINISNEVLNKIKKPSPNEFRDIWRLLCKYSHASNDAGARIFDSEKDLLAIYVNFAILKSLLECNYHLFNSHFVTNSMNYYATLYDKESSKIRKIRDLKLDMRKTLTENKKDILKENRKFIYDYKLKWILK